MPKGNPSHKEARREEIINACIQLYKTLSFKNVTIKDIAEYTTFSRPSIYNYFETKEEIFLAIFQKEYELWKKDLDKIATDKKKLTVKLFADKLSKTLEKRFMLLKLLSMNLYDMEESSRIECLIEFKTAYASSITALTDAVKRAFPKIAKAKCDSFIFSFLPFMIGIYPYAYATHKQKDAMDKAGIKHKKLTVRELVTNTVLKLL